jgi:small subunit ribosomal protein S2
MNNPTLQQLLEAGVHFGHQVRRGHPKMRQYIYGAREGVHVIDLTKSAEGLKQACDFANELGKSGQVLLLVGTKKQAKPVIEAVAKELNIPYLSSRWIGGFLTNFDEISKNIKKLKELREQKEKGQLSHYTKKEQLLISRKIAKLEQDLSGVQNLEKIPEALFIVDMVREDTAIKEALVAGVKTIAIADSNSNPMLVDYPIPGNDDAIKSIKILTEAIAISYDEGRKKAGSESKEPKESELKVKKADKKTEEILAEIPEAVAIEVAVAEEEVEKETVADNERKVE